MADEIAQIIAVANPGMYLEGSPREVEGFKRKAMQKKHDKSIIDSAKPKGAAEEHNLVYDSSSETLEPVYFWILDMANSFFGGKVEKLVDNFSSSPGSGHFAELGQRATVMQQQASKIMGDINIVIKSIMNIIYDLKEFQIRLKHYGASRLKNPDEAKAGLLSLKQIWMDNVDIKRGRGSINMLAQDLNFVTIRDAFMIADSLDDIKKLDLNERVKRILDVKLSEFIEWKERSEKELKKRYEIEKSYLKSQVNSLKLYSSWAKPYLKAATELTMKERDREPSLVKVFNTILLELTLMGRSKFKFEDAVVDRDLPEAFAKYKLKRDYYSCVLIDFKFRGIPQRVGQQAHYAFGGRVEVKFRAYALNQDELDLINALLDDSSISETLRWVSGMTDESLNEMKEDIDEFLKEESDSEKEARERAKEEDINPFSALIGIGRKKPAKEGEDKDEEKGKKAARIKMLKEKGARPDDWVEKMVRKLAEEKARNICFKIFDVYKKAHGMASHPDPFEYWNK
ncbi:hypothetical protein HYT92_01445 [Candidatus Pacearchaeota archaeon]|nr:hypothetical protein [Candidatus Pacearchaeota archaeon]